MDGLDLSVDAEPRTYVLTEYQRRYLQTGEVPPETDQTAVQLEQAILNTVTHMGDRTKDYLTDLYLLGTVDTDIYDTQALWAQFVGTPAGIEAMSATGGLRELRSQSPDAVRLGYELFRAIRAVLPAESDALPADFLLGGVYGLIARPHEEAPAEHAQLMYLLQHILQKSRLRYVTSVRQRAVMDFGYSLLPNLADVEEAIKKSDIRPATPVLEAVAKQLYQKNDSFTEENAASVLSMLQDETPLEEVNHLACMMEADSSKIQDKRWRGCDALDVLAYLWDQQIDSEPGDFATANKIARGTDSALEDNLITVILEDLANPDRDTNRRHPRYPVVAQNAAGAWQLTAYGTVLCYHLFEHTLSGPWVYWYAIDRENLTNSQQQYIRSALKTIREDSDDAQWTDARLLPSESNIEIAPDSETDDTQDGSNVLYLVATSDGTAPESFLPDDAPEATVRDVDERDPTALRSFVSASYIDIIQTVSAEQPPNIHALARSLNRDIGAVREDIEDLVADDIMELEGDIDKHRPVIPYDQIEIRLGMSLT